MKNLNPEQQEKIRSSLLKGEYVLDSNLWSDRIIAAKYTENRGFKGRDIVDMIRSGAHDGGIEDRVLDIDIVGFYRASSTIGYTYLGSLTQWINRKFLNKYTESDVFKHVMHETMHRCFRFLHRYRKSTSVPYRVGNLSRDAFIEYYSIPRPQPLTPPMTIFIFKD